MRCSCANTVLIILNDSFEDVTDRNDKPDDPRRCNIDTEDFVCGACERSVTVWIVVWWEDKFREEEEVDESEDREYEILDCYETTCGENDDYCEDV